MSRRRTKEEKLKAKHSFTISWKPNKESPKTEAKNDLFEATVKGQFENQLEKKESKNPKIKRGDYLDKFDNLGTIKRDLLKSLIIAGIIVASEIVLYLILPKTGLI